MKCKSCDKTINGKTKSIKCSECSEHYHLSCTKLTENDFDYIISNNSIWKCSLCEKKKRDDNTPVTPVAEKPKFFGAINSPGNSDSDRSEYTGTKSKVVCNDCKKGFSYNAHRAVCKECESNFHFKCINLSKDDYYRIQTEWQCKSCTQSLDVQSVEESLKNVDSKSISLVDILNEMKLFRQEVQNQNKEFTQSLNTYSNWIVENGEKIKEVGEKVSTIIKDMDLIKQQNCDLKKNNEMLSKRINMVEQSARDNVVEINGVPFIDKENVIDNISKISAEINFEFDCGMVDYCYRYRSAGVGAGTRPSGIVVRFVRKRDKEGFIEK